MLPHRLILAVILVSALLTAGCGEIISNLGDLKVVQNELAKRFGDEVTVHTTAGENGNMVVVWFLNSSLNDDSAEQRSLRAAAAAKVIKETYSRIKNVRELWIGFMRLKTRFVVFHNSQIVSVYSFDNNAMPLVRHPVDREAPTEIQVTPSYDEKTNVTDISVSGIQLEGKVGGFGITVLPYFKVSGRTGVARLTPPKTVQLNFASYAEKPRFEQTVPISFVAEGKVVLQTEGTFTGHDAQFCYLTIPYKSFHRMVTAKDLVIKLGDTGFPLTPSQLGAMKHMTDFVAE